MTNLKLLKESLMSKKKGGRELTAQERKHIKGGYYASLEECKEDCRAPGGSWGGWSHKDSCKRIGNTEFWDCKDS